MGQVTEGSTAMSKKSNGAEKARKIILFLSDLKTGSDVKEQTYICPEDESPDGKCIKEVRGTQTNEAPVKYLLGAYRDVREVLCIVTEKVTTPVETPEGIITTALETFQEMMEDQAPEVTVTPIEFKDKEDFANGPLAEIMSRMKKGDEILLDTTGGLRDAIMQLLLVSRALSFSGIPTVGAVYANYGARQIVDCFHLIGLFDLVGGMQEMASFGSVKTLRDYYGDTAEPEVKALLDAMEELQENITLCRTGKLDDCIKRFNKAMKGAESCEDPLVKALLPAFQDKFGKKLTVPGLILWCINSDMLQQALTIYTERIPGYLLGPNRKILIVRKDAKPIPDLKPYETEVEGRFVRQLLRFRMLKTPWYYLADTDYTLGEGVSFSQLQTILRDYQYIKLLRNMVNHASDGDGGDGNEKMEYLVNSKPSRYKTTDQVEAKDIREALERGLNYLKLESEE